MQTGDHGAAGPTPVPATRATEPAAGHVAALDGVRGLAIGIVLIHNAAWVERVSDAYALKLTTAVTATGWIGVQIFFVLSGFLITGILLDALGKPQFFRTFYVRRTLRIFPVYYAFLATVFVVGPLAIGLPAWSADVRANQWWYWIYASNWMRASAAGAPGLSHFWSLAVEEQFYVVWPLVVFVLSRRGLVRLCIALLVMTPVVRVLLHQAGFPQQAGYTFTIARCDALAAGALLATLLRSDAGRAWLARRIAGLTGATLLALALLVGVERGFHSDDLGIQVVGQSLITGLSFSLIHACVAPAGNVGAAARRAMSTNWLRFLGKYSYAMYIFHFPIHTVALNYAGDWINAGDPATRLAKLGLYIACISALSVIAALLSWSLLEKPCLALKDRLAPRRA